MFESKEHYDLSDMKLEQFNDSENKKMVGKFKDETQGIPVCEFIGLRNKMYSIKLDDVTEKKTAKGIVRNVIKKHLKHENYKRIIETGDIMNSSMKMIRSYDHQIYTVNVNKVSLSAYDDKRFIRNDGISSYAYGHNAIINCAMQDTDTGATAKVVELGGIMDDAELGATVDDAELGATVNDAELGATAKVVEWGATVDDDDAWLYISYDI